MIPFLAATLGLGTILGLYLSRGRVFGKLALGYTLLPFAGLGLGIVFC
ncbi:MAG TPA: hypothetical protein VFS19_07355 [Planctomycetota bacterium]|nr:hypothetical protein [Planctomycetota bacterium]